LNHIADPFVVVLDASVLYPVRKKEVLLRFAQRGLYRARWSATIMEEWVRNAKADSPEQSIGIDRHVSAIEEHFPECWVSGFEPLIEGLTLPDPDDRHVLAAAIRCSAQHIVTDNLKHFPDKILENHDMTAITADDFLSNTFDLYISEAIQVLRQLREIKTKPPFTSSEFIIDLTKKGLPKLAAKAKRHIENL
jgi:predicted nucleic acid-binding protein